MQMKGGQMIEQIMNVWTCAIVLLSIPFQAVRIYFKWKCRKKHYLKPVNTCHENECKFAKCCPEYEYLLSDEEAERLEELIEKLKK